MTEKSLFYIILCGTFALLAAPLGAYAASLTLSASVKTVTEGDTFHVSMFIDPARDKIFTVKASVAYPADLLRVVSFTFGETWMALSQPGFNEIDNTAGILTKTAGYPGGFSSRTALGTITFRALKEGDAMITIRDQSSVLNAESKNILTEKGTAAFTLAARRPSKNNTPNPSPEIHDPVTKKADGTLVPERFSDTNAKIPDNIPSPDNAWLYTKLAAFSIAALILQHRWAICVLAGILIYILFLITRRIVRNRRRRKDETGYSPRK